VSKVRGAVVSIAAITLVLTPLARDPIAGDSFPLSTYPMFAFERRLRETFTYAVGRTASGERRTIEPGHVANHEVMQAYMELTRTPPRTLCPRIAARVAADEDLRDVVTIEMVRATHDAVALLVRGERGAEKVLHSCEVPR
jgi:hypothetical protein